MKHKRGDHATRQILQIIREEFCPQTSRGGNGYYSEEYGTSDDPVNAELINNSSLRFNEDLQMGIEHVEEIVLTVGEHFSIELPDDAHEKIQTIKDLATLIRECAEEQQIDLCR